MTFYLKYRSQTIDELDLDNVRQQLQEVLKSPKIPHAFLFSGSRGLGKTSAARILAKSVNCLNQKKGEVEPCNQCENCLSITQGSNPDVMEIDGASNRGIDDVRALRESIMLAPLSLKKKIYIIDEVHMLTKEAFNALLKTLEEPPEHVIFILATTESHKLPETIISRTFNIVFNRATKTEIKRSLQRVILGEKLNVDDEVLDAVIKKANGGFRDSVKMLEQLAFSGKKIDLDSFNKIFYQADIIDFLKALIKKEAQICFEWIEKQEKSGADWTEITRNILIKLREIMLSNYGLYPKEEITIEQEELNKLMTLFNQAGYQIKASLISTLPIEIIVSKWCSNESNNDNNSDSNNGNIRNSSKSETNKVKKESPIDSSPKEIKSNGINPISNPILISFNEIKSKWGEILARVQSEYFSMETCLRQSDLIKFTDNNLVIKVYYSIHKDRLESEKCLKILEDIFWQIFEFKPKIKYELGDKKEKEAKDNIKDQELSKNIEEVFS